ncbi:MAG: hypothetical protein ACYYK0_01800 [Candidatus Eutrophobiaceae bacterium]
MKWGKPCMVTALPAFIREGIAVAFDQCGHLYASKECLLEHNLKEAKYTLLKGSLD